MLKKNRWNILLSNAFILLPMVAGLLFWEQLPKAADSFKEFVVLWMPLLMLAVQWVAILFTCLDKRNREQSPKVISLVLWIIPVIHLFTCGVMYMAMRGSENNLFGITLLPIGAMFVFIGNYMPKCKQNSTIGVKIKWTLQSEENWNATHRIAGKTWIVGGLLLMLLVWLPMTWAITGLMVTIGVMILIPTVYSYRFYRKEKEEGKEWKSYQPSKSQRIGKKVSLVMVPLILIGCCVLMFTGEVEVVCRETSLKIKADYYTDMTIDYAEIERIEYRPEGVGGSRVYGYGSARLKMGSYSNKEFGTYTRYTCGDNGAVVLWLEEEVVVVSGASQAKTKQIYETLLEKGVGQ